MSAQLLAHLECRLLTTGIKRAHIGPPSLWFKRLASQAVRRRFESGFVGIWSLDRRRVKFVPD